MTNKLSLSKDYLYHCSRRGVVPPTTKNNLILLYIVGETPDARNVGAKVLLIYIFNTIV